jgi:hypothetical protein
MALGLACASGAMAEDDWRMPDWQPAGISREARIGRDLLLRESPATGNCGDHEFSAYADKDSDMPEFSYCAGTLKYRPRGRGSPDFLVSGVRIGSDISGPSGWVVEDLLLRQEKGHWTETVIMAVEYQDGKPRTLEKN